MRDPVLNALSILQCYRSGNYEWFSVLPPNMPPLLYKTATDIQKSVYQVFFSIKYLIPAKIKLLFTILVTNAFAIIQL